MKIIKHLLVTLCLCTIPLSVIAEDRFTVRSIGDERIVAIGFYNAANPESLLSGVPVRVGINLYNTITGETLHKEAYSISLPSGTPSAVTGNNNIGRIVSDYDIDTGELRIRFSKNVEDSSGFLSVSRGGAEPSFPTEFLFSETESQFKVTFVVDFTGTNGSNFVNINSGSVDMTSLFGDGISPLIFRDENVSGGILNISEEVGIGN